MKKQLFFVFLGVFIFGISTYAQGKLSGVIFEDGTTLPLPGASIVVKGSTVGTSSDFDGKFSLEVSKKSGVLVISYVGFLTKEIAFDLSSGNQNFKSIKLIPDAQSLEEVVIIGSGVIDLARDRQTPIAVSTIPITQIRDKSGNAEFPELMKNTPSVQVAGQGSGFGEARINIRGFKQDNTAYLLNGQPINGMEDGKLYWSNWSGLTDIANAIQIQRGLGSSKLAISSVGGTVNIVTKATEMKKSAFLKSTVGNNQYYKTTVGVNTGMLDNGFGVSALFTYWQGDGYNDGTRGQGQSYFLSFGYKPNKTHAFNFLITGAPQWHDQNFSKTIDDYLKYGKRYNNNWGYLNGEYYSTRRNYYHKPVANLNWDWNISDHSSLSTVLYASWGRGGGTGPLGERITYTKEGLVDFDKITARNEQINNSSDNGIGFFKNKNTRKTSGYLLRASVNSHQWYGIVSNYQHNIGEHLSLNTGVDLRSYTGLHIRQITDFLGLKGFYNNDPKRASGANMVMESFVASPWKALYQSAPENQRIAWDYSETIRYGGIFGQAEYKNEWFSSFFQGSVSRQYHDRFDRYQYSADKQKAKQVANNGFNVKSGLNFKLSTSQSLYGNIGYYSRQPYHDNIYLNYGNDVNPLTKNEKIFGIEAGYSYNSSVFSANINLYRTSWKDRVTTKSSADENNSIVYTNNSGVSQLHQGAEFDFKWKPADFFTLKGFTSYGYWIYDNDVFIQTFDENLNLVKEVTENISGGRVGDSPQFQAGLGTEFRFNRIKLDFDWKFNDMLYADVVTKNNLLLPSYHLLDGGISYDLPLYKTSSVKFRFNVNNILDKDYISDVSGKIYQVDNTTKNTYNGLDTRNKVLFGNGRTWNFNITLNF